MTDLSDIEKFAASTRRCVVKNCNTVVARPHDISNKTGGHSECTAGDMNPQAEALKGRTFTFALNIIRFCRTLRDTWEGRELSDQLFRSGTRVGANYRSTCRARSHPDFVAKMGFVVEEADESVYWLELIKAAEITKDVEVDGLLDESSQLSRIFNQSQLAAKTNATSRRAQ